MNELAFVLAILGALWLGFYLNRLWDKIKDLEEQLKARSEVKKAIDIEPESTFFDPDDIVQAARFEQAEIQRQLNPDK